VSLYLTDLADVLRRAGLPVVEVSGWQTRARGSGGYASGRPTHVMWHHTASTTSAQNDVNYQCYGSPDKPIANLYFARDGAVWVMAAGATNTNGKGSDTWGGGVPNDKMNEYAIGCEIGNGGTGEPYPMAQQNAVMTAAKAMAHAYNIPAHKHRAHFEWAPGRKIDPYGPSRWNNDTNTFWDMNRFRNDIEAGGPVVPPSDPLLKFVYAGIDTNGTNYNTQEWHVPSGGAGLVWQGDGSLRCCQIRNGKVTLGIQNPMSYNRPLLTKTLSVPYTVSGMIFLHSRAADPWIIGEDRAPTWDWAPNIHPVFVDEDNNVVSGLSPTANRWGASGQINKVYGIPRKEVFVAEMNHDAQMGAWHHFRMHVPRVGTHEIYWDDVLVYRVVEKDPPDGPAAWWPRSLHAALRLDFYDYSLRDLDPGPIAPPTQGDDIDMIGIDWRKGTPQYTGLVSTGTQLAWAFDGNAYGVYINAGMKSQAVNDTQLDALIKSSQTTTDCPPTFTGARRTLWNEQRG